MSVYFIFLSISFQDWEKMYYYCYYYDYVSLLWCIIVVVVHYYYYNTNRALYNTQVKDYNTI